MTAPSVKNLLMNGASFKPDLINEDFSDIVNYIAQRNNGGSYWDNVNATTSLITNLTVTNLIAKGPWVDVRAYATSGTGTAADPWLGWDTAITWTAGVRYYFPSGSDGLHGCYSYATSPSWTKEGLVLKGDSSSSSVLLFTGSGVAVNFDGTAGSGGGIFNICMEDLLIRGNASCTYGIYALATHHFNLKNITILDTPTAGIFADFVVLGTWENIRVTNNVYGPVQSTITPSKGIILSKNTGSDKTSVVTLINPIVEAVTNEGIQINFGGGNVIIGGVCESNGTGLDLTDNCNDNLVIGLDTEANSTIDTHIGGVRNTIYNGGGTLHLVSPATDNRFISGTFITTLTIDASCLRNEFITGSYNGTLTDNGTGTRFLYFKHSSTGTYVTTKLTEAVTFGSTITTPLTASRALTTGASNELAVSATTATELGYVNGVTSAIQTQLGTKKAIATGNAFKFETTDTSGNLQETTVTASRAVATDSNGLPTASTTTAAELGTLSGSTAFTDYSATSTIVGFSSFTTKSIFYTVGANGEVTVWFHLAGNSDSATTSFTLPFSNNASILARGWLALADNGATQAALGVVNVPVSSSTATCFKDNTGATWTAASTKTVIGQFSYKKA